MIVLALLGAVILTDATQVSSHIRTESSPSMPSNPSTPAPMLSGSDLATRIGHVEMFDAAPQIARPLQNRAIPEGSLVLTGTIAYTDPRQGFAIIGSSAQHTYLARPGQQLPDGSRIREIYPKHVVLERGGSLEIVGLYVRGQAASAVYAQIHPLPQQAQEAEAIGVTGGDTTPSHTRLTDTPPGDPRPGDIRPSDLRSSDLRSNDLRSNDLRSNDLRSNDLRSNDLRPNDLPANEAQSNDAPPSDAPPKNVLPRWARPQTPLPAAQDPADDLNDYRRRRAESRGLFHQDSPIQSE